MPRDDTPPATDCSDPVVLSVTVTLTERIDRFLADQLDLSRTQAARLVAGGHVVVDGEPTRASRQVTRGALITVTLPQDEPPRRLTPYPLALQIVYEDDALAVIDKPPGLVVHPAPGHWHDTLVNALVARGTTLAGGAAGRPGIVHRLDRDTSGLMVIAKTDLAHRRLGALLAARRIRRVYAALAWGHLSEDTTIDAPIARHRTDRQRMAVIPEGRPARTDVFVIARLGPVDLVRLELHTGRTHQIRLHLESIGHPVVGDPVYGGGGARRISGEMRGWARRLDALAPRQALHAASLAFRHPISGVPLRLRSRWPADLTPLLEAVQLAETPWQDDPLDQLGFHDRDR